MQDAAYVNAMQSGTRSCPVCRGDIHPERVFKTSAFEPTDEELNALKSVKDEIIDLTMDDDDAPIPVEDIKGKGKAVVKAEGDLDGLGLEVLDKGDNFEPSAKMMKMVEFIKHCTSSRLISAETEAHIRSIFCRAHNRS